MDTQNPALKIRSEVGPLKTILLHRPGGELERLIPKYLDEMLFEDIPYLAQMQVEHDKFAEVLRANGAEVLYFEKLLEDILEAGNVKEAVIAEITAGLRVNSAPLKEDIRALLAGMPPGELTATLLSGLSKKEVTHSEAEKRLSFYIKDEYPFYIDPLPNLYFSRDYGTVIGTRLSVNTMKARARKRESMLLQHIAEHHPRFRGCKLWHRHNEPDSIEGGDILVLSDSVIAVGCSARTSPEGIETLASRLFAEDETVREILVIQIPFTRAYMHLDTVFTMVDVDKFTIFPGIADSAHVFRLSPEGPQSRRRISIRQEKNLARTLAKSLNLPAVRLIATGDGDTWIAEREQWNDSTNTLAIAPGKVITYRRNILSNKILRQNGVEVLEIAGSELVRGRGGPRCMSMPLRRSSTG